MYHRMLPVAVVLFAGVAVAAGIAVYKREFPAYASVESIGGAHMSSDGVINDGQIAVIEDDIYPLEWLQERITVQEAERMHTRAPDERSARIPALRKPFGFRNAQWEELKARMWPGDELWTFASPAESWRHLAGRSGIALVRNKKMVCAIVTLMN